MDLKKINVAIIGATGYVGQKLLNILSKHPNVNVSAIGTRLNDKNNSKVTIKSLFPQLIGINSIKNTKVISSNVNSIKEFIDLNLDFVFLSLPHGISSKFAFPFIENGIKVIDLSADFRVRDPLLYKEFYKNDHPCPTLLKESVYGLPEIYEKEIKNAKLIASPGCFPTSIILPLIPILNQGLIDPKSIIASSISGVSGAGKSLQTKFLFSEINESIQAYGIPKHRHLSEIEQELSLSYLNHKLKNKNENIKITFVPHLAPITYGIMTSIYCNIDVNELDGLSDKITNTYKKFYKDKPFIRILDENKFVNTKNVIGTNFIDISWVIDYRTNRLIILSAEDNMGKGASSQAIQSFNIMNNLPISQGLI